MINGIIVRIDWNDNNWEKPSFNLDYAKNFEFVKENDISYTAFNFAHQSYETEPDGLWYGLIPSFYSKTPDKDKIRDLKVVFMIGNFEKKDYIVGLYAYPKIGNKKRKILIPGYNEYNQINIGSEKNNILRLENFVEFNNLNHKKALGNQQIASQGWNYIESSCVGYIFDSIEKINPDNKLLKQIKYKCLK